MKTKDPIYKKFLATLKYEAKKNWYRQNNILAMEAGISSGSLTEILKENSKATFETREALARACGYEYEDFLEFGKELLAGKDKNSLVSINPFVEIIREYIKENNLDLTPENAKKAVWVLKKYAKNRGKGPENVTPIIKEHQELIKGFYNKKKGLKANKLMIKLEKLNKREFYKYIADLEGLVEELEEKNKNQKEDSDKAVLEE
ncbi:MAG: hypothetical protein GXP56_12620 [Deltaproteobacteria bacterium]|nr:hypothetical protein [Deltaproteobacteria bacterium]